MKICSWERKEGDGGFTLLEILVVMTLIFILAGMSMTAIKGAMEQARKKDAEHTALNLVGSISTYIEEYRRFPLEGKQAGSGDVWVETDEVLMNILLGQEDNPHNPSGSSFYNGRNASGKPPRNGVVFNDDGGGRLYDPWGNLYRVMMDADYNKRVKPPFQKTGIAGANIVAKDIVVWSLGPDGEESGEGAKDNVTTW